MNDNQVSWIFSPILPDLKYNRVQSTNSEHHLSAEMEGVPDKGVINHGYTNQLGAHSEK